MAKTQRPDATARGGRRLRAGVGIGVAVTAIALAASACTTGTTTAAQTGPSTSTSAPGTSTSASGTVAPGGGGTTTQSSATPAPTTSTTPPPQPVQIAADPAGSKNLNPTTPITVSSTHGTLTSVVLKSSDGRTVSGTMSADKTSWHSTEVLGYSKTYKLVAKGKGDPADDPSTRAKTMRSTFTTLTPHNMTMPYFQRTGGYSLDNGATYGVGIVPIVHFDEDIADRAAAQKTVTITTSPHVSGSFYWDGSDRKDLYWRPQHYWKPGTKVTVAVNDYGKQVSPGLWGQADAKMSFTIGRRQITVADDNAPQVDKVRVYNGAGKLLRTMNTSMGKHGGETLPDGSYINFYTLEGTYTVIAHENPAIMSSASYGLGANQPGGYAPEPIYWSTKISVDGIYLHELNSTQYYQDNGYDVSHGCLNLTTDNATWFYQHSMIGDPVEVRHTGGPKIQVWDGGVWSVPWSQWKAGSAV